MEELNIGHTIISRAALVGIERAVREMKAAMGGNWSLVIGNWVKF
jgi:pyridoxine 5-phosphate synthase